MVSFNVLIRAITTVVLISPTIAMSDWVCWSSDRTGEILCSNSGTGEPIAAIKNIGKPLGMAIDQVHNILFWADGDTERVMSVILGETDLPNVVAQLPVDAGLRGLAVSSSLQKIYWVTENSRKIQRANYDGSQLEDLPVPDGSFFGVLVDESSSQLYWTSGNEILRGNLDGSTSQAIIFDAAQPYYLAIDSDSSKLYWTDFGSFEIGRANLDGSAREIPGPFSDLLSRPIGVALDSATNKIYWTLESGAVQSANTDGTELTTVHDNLESTWDILLTNTLPTAIPVPTVSTWGLIILSLLIMIVGTICVLHSEYNKSFLRL